MSGRLLSAALALAAALVAGGGRAADIVRVAVPQLPTTLGNPYVAPFGGAPSPFSLTAVFEGLSYVDQTGVVRPQLAVAWEQTAPDTWRFRLRTDVVFSNGALFDSGTVVANFEIIRGPESADYAVVRPLAHVTSVKAVAPDVVEFKTRRPDPFLPQLMSILLLTEPAHWRSAGRDGFARNPVGTGPFAAQAWVGKSVRLMRAETAWRRAALAEMEFLEIVDPVSRLQGLLSGDLDVVFSMGPDDVEAITGAGHHVFSRPEPGVVTLIFNTNAKSPLQDVRVRQALNYAVDRTAIVRGILGDKAAIPTQFAPHTAYGFIAGYDPYPHDVAKARRLLEEAGYAQGFAIDAEAVQGMSSYSTSIYQLLAAQLANVGVTLRVSPVQVPRYNAILFQNAWKGLATNLDYAVDPTMDALAAISRHGCSGVITGYCDEAMMPLLAAAENATDPVARLAATQQVVRRQTEQAPGIPLWEKVRFDAYAGSIEGFVHHLSYVPYDQLQRKAGAR